MKALATAVVFLLGLAFAGPALAACPGTVTDCPSPTYKQVVVGAATGGAQGTGSVNAQSFWINGAAFTPYTLPQATTSVLGGVKCDGTTILCSSGVISAVTGGGGNVSSVGTPTTGQLAQWTGSTTIQGISLGTGVSGALAASVTGTGGMVLATGPTIAGLTVTGSLTATGLVTNGDLANASTTVNGQTCTLGSPCTVTASNPNSLTISTHLTGSSYNGSAPVTIATDATNLNTPSTLVARDASGNFNAGTITANLTGGASLDLPLAGGTLTGKLNTLASATGGAGLNLPQGAAPTSPVNGDVWTTSSGLFVQIAGATVGPLGTGGGGSAFSSLTGGTNTSAAMVVGTGASLAATGSGSIAATAVPVGGITGLGANVATALAIAPQTTGSFARQSGTITPGNCLQWSASGITDAGSLCGSGGTGITQLTGDVTAGPGSGSQPATVGKVNGVSYPSAPSTNTVAVVTGVNTTTYEAVPNAALANSATTVNGQTCTLGSPCTVTATASNTLTFGTHLTGTSYNGSAPITLGTDATNANTASTLVARDASGNFSAGTITAALTGHASLDLALSGGTLTGKLNTLASATGGAGLNLPAGAAPTAPANGDIWTTTSGLFVQINGGTVGPLAAAGGAPAFSSLTGGTNTAAAMVVGTGASLSATGSGAITATAAPLAGITGAGAGVITFLTTPSSANLAAAVTGETGTGALVFGTGPTIAGGALSGTFTGTPTFSGNLIFSGVPSFTGTLTGTQTQCLGLSSGNVLVASAGACGTGGGAWTLTDGTNSVSGVTTETVGPGLVVGGSAGSATLSLNPTVRTAASPTLASTDFSGSVNISSGGITAPAGLFSGFSTATIFIGNQQGSSAAITNSTGLTINTGGGCNGTSIPANFSQQWQYNGTSIDCWQFASSGSGSSAFSSLTSGTNTAAAMVVGTGASLAATGSGTITATAAPLSGISGLGTGVATFLATPSSANLAATVTGETGSGALVFGTGPTIAGGALSGTFTGTPTFSGNLIFSGVPSFTGTLTGTQTQCLGLSSGNALVASAGACGAGGGGSLTVTDGTHSVASTTTLTTGPGFIVGGSAGSATINWAAPFRTAAAPTVVAGDMGGGIYVSSGTITIPAISSTIFAAGQTLQLTNYSGSTAPVTSSPAINANAGCVSGTGIPAGFTWLLSSNGTTLDCAQVASSASGSVSSVSNSDSTLTISPTTGAVVASLNLGQANAWTGDQTFNGAGVGLTVANNVALGATSTNPIIGIGSSAATSGSFLQLKGPVATTRATMGFTGSSARWMWGVGSTAESGGNAGSNWFVERFDDAGTVIDNPLVIFRSTGAAQFSGLVQTAASATGGAGINLPQGAAPTAPNNGDLWTTSSGLFVRIAGSTIGPLAASGGSPSFSSVTGGTNTAAAMVVGTGASLSVTGSGTIAATSAPVSGLTGGGTGVVTALGSPVTGSGGIVLATGPSIASPTVTGTYTGPGMTDAGAGVIIGGPTGGAKGVGTLNVQAGLYVQGVLQTIVTPPSAGALAYYSTTGAQISGAAITANVLPKSGGTSAPTASSITDNAGVTIGSPTGGAQGAGTLNATGLFVNGVAVAGANGVGVQAGQSPSSIGDNATALPSGHYVYATNVAMTAARSHNLPDSATQGAGDIEVIDSQQTVTSTNTLTVAAAGTNTLNGVTNGTAVISTAGGAVGLHNDGAGNWTTTWFSNLPPTSANKFLNTNASGIPGWSALGSNVATAMGNALSSVGGLPTVVASGTATLGTSAIASGACATVVTVSATGVATTDVVNFGYNADPSAVTGYGASATGAVLTVYPYPTANNVNVKVCNSTASSITPGAMTLNFRVSR